MATVSKRRKKPAGSSPGSVVYVGVEKTTPVKVARIRYSGDGYEAPRIVAPSECRPESSWPGVDWFTVDGLTRGRSACGLGLPTLMLSHD